MSESSALPTPDPLSFGIATPGIFRRRSLGGWLTVAAILFYLVPCFTLFFYAESPINEFANSPYIEADSTTYWILALDSGSPALAGQVSVGGNLLGPITEARVLRTRFAVAVFNAAIFIAGFYVVSTLPGFRLPIFAGLMMMEGWTPGSVITLNKEIFGFLSFILICRFLYGVDGRFAKLAIVTGALIFSLAARWEQTLVLLIFLIFRSRFWILHRRRLLTLTLLAVGVGVAYTLALKVLNIDLGGFISQTEGAGLITRLDAVQANYGYPLVVIPKIIMNVTGNLLRPSYYLNQYWDSDFRYWQLQFFEPAHELVITALVFLCLFTRRLRLESPLVFLAAIYLIVTSINPFVQPRYQYPTYVLLALEFARHVPAVLNSTSSETSRRIPEWH